MRKMIKLAIGLAALGFVGLIGLSTISILWAIAAPRQEVTVHERDWDRAVYDTFNAPAQIPRTVESNWATPAQIQVNVHDSWFDIAGSFAGVILVVGVFTIVFLVVRSMRRGRTTNPSDDTALVHELARRAQDLAQRMEALETILLDRTRATR